MHILIIDDHKIFTEALKALLENIDFIDKVFDVNDEEDAIKVIKEENIRIILLDINLKKTSGLDLLPILLKHKPEVKVIALTSHDDYWTIDKAINIGFHGYLLKTDNKLEIETALLEINEGNNYISSQIDKKNLNNSANTFSLTERELEILKAICDGLSTKEIANKYFISIKTVETHRSKLFDKLDVRNVNELIKKAYQYSIISI
ncbi:MAG TPA: response regulator transcription factor [Chitinophagaceae bacterium]|nr:response regulator transcription factor [Chitinophagaceae bacterium]